MTEVWYGLLGVIMTFISGVGLGYFLGLYAVYLEKSEKENNE